MGHKERTKHLIYFVVVIFHVLAEDAVVLSVYENLKHDLTEHVMWKNPDSEISNNITTPFCNCQRRHT
jgi:hypothetical protein